MSLLCTLKNLNLTFGTKVLFKDAFFNITVGDRIGLIGLNGKGKSSLFKILTGDINPDQSIPAFEFDKAKSDPQKEYSCFLVPQELMLDNDDSICISEYFYKFYPQIRTLKDSLDKFNKKLENQSLSSDETEELLRKQTNAMEEFERLGGWEIFQEFESYMKYFGIDDLSLNVKDLSGGEQKKILLSLGFSARDNLILWDEPTNHLDLETISLFEDKLNNTDKTFVLISHDRYLLGKVTNKIFHINNSKINTFDGSYVDFLNYLKEEEKNRKLQVKRLENSLRRETAWMRQGIKARRTRSKKRVDDYYELKDKIGQIKGEFQKSMQLDINQSNRKTKCLVDFKDVSLSFEDKNLFSDVTLKANKGDKIGLLGANGVGKTSLVKLITQKLTPSNGNIKLAEDLVIRHFDQKREILDTSKTSFEILGEGNDYVIMPNGNQRHVASYFESFLFSRDDLHRPISTLSGGEKNRLQMAINLLKAGDLWIFDEPTNDLDLQTLNILEDKLTEFEGTIILISHDRSFLSNVTNKIWLLRNKSLELFNGGYEQAQEYIDALTIEDMIEDSSERFEDQKEFQVQVTEKVEEKRKLSYKEKQHLKKLPKLIENLEKNIEILEEKMGEFDFSNMDQDKNLEYSKLETEKNESEELLLKYYEDLESLSEV